MIKVLDVPISMYADNKNDVKTESFIDSLRTMRSIDWRIAPEATSEEIEQIIKHIKSQGFDTLFQSGSFRYIMGGEYYGERNWWNTIPWKTYKNTIIKIKQACQKYNIKLVLHLTANLAMKDDYKELLKGMACHNLKTNAEEKWIKYSGYALCSNNPEFRKIYLSRLRELIALTSPSGLMIDEVTIAPTNESCGCKYCRQLFKEKYGIEAPSPKDKNLWYNYNNPNWRAWQEFRKQTVADWNKTLKDCLRDVNKDSFYTGCCCNPLYGPLPVWCGYDPISKHKDIFYEAEPLNPWSWRHTIAEGKWASANGRPVMLLGYAASLSQEYFQTLLGMSQGWALHEWVEFNEFRTVTALWYKKWKPLWLGNKQFCNVAIISPTTHLTNKYFYGEKRIMLNTMAGQRLSLRHMCSLKYFCQINLRISTNIRF